MPPRSQVKTTGPYTSNYQHYADGTASWDVDVVTHSKWVQIDDTSTPDWRERIRRGEIVNNNGDMLFDNITSEGNGSYYAVRKLYPNDVNHGFGPVTGAMAGISPPLNYQVAPNYIGIGNSVEIAKFKAIKNLDTTPYAFGEDLAELGQTLRFLRNPLTSLANVAKTFQKKSRVLRRPTRSSKLSHIRGRSADSSVTLTRAQSLSNVYLTERFAVTPLINSIYDAVAAYHALPPIAPRRVARGFSTAGEVDELILSESAHFTWSSSEHRNTSAKAGIIYSVSNPIDTWRESLGFRFQDLPETVWAVMPYSFMIDRVVDISGAIRGLMALSDPGLKVEAAWTTEKRVSHRIDQCLSQKTLDWDVTIQGDKMKHEKCLYHRSVWNPNYLDTVPPVNLGGLWKDLTSTADLLALILARLR